MSNQNNNSAFQMIADVDGDLKDFLNVHTPDRVPILALRNMVLFPGVVTPILIGRQASKALVEKAEKKGLIIGVVAQRDPDVDYPDKHDLYEVGVYAKVMKLLTLPNGNITAILQGLGRFELNEIVSTSPYLEGDVTALEEDLPDPKDREFNTAVADLRDMVSKYVTVSDEIPDEASFAIKNISNTVMMLNFVCTNMPFNYKEKQKLLEIGLVKERLFTTMKMLNREINLQNLKADIRNKTREDIDEQQRNYFLQQQIKNMQAEMGNGESPEKHELLTKGRYKMWKYEMAKYFRKECDKLDNLNPQRKTAHLRNPYTFCQRYGHAGGRHELLSVLSAMHQGNARRTYDLHTPKEVVCLASVGVLARNRYHARDEPSRRKAKDGRQYQTVYDLYPLAHVYPTNASLHGNGGAGESGYKRVALTRRYAKCPCAHAPRHDANGCGS